MKRLTTFLMALLLTWIGANAQIANGDYVIINKEAGQFLYGSYNWGCESSLGSKPVTFTATTTSEGVYTLKDNQWSGDHYVGVDFYTDKTSAGSINITAVTDDEGYYYLSSTSGYLIGNGKNKYTTVTAEPDLTSDASKWQFVTEEEILAGMDEASSANPVDVSILISNPNFRPNGNGVTTVSNWTATNVTVGSYSGNYVQANAAEAYNQNTFSISQTITLPKAGYYNLSAQGFYRNGSDGTGTNTVSAQMYFGDETVDLDARRTTANTMAEAWAVFLEGSEPVNSITYYATSADEEVEIGFTGAVPNASWAIFGELQLEYLGETLEYAIGEPECTTAYVQPGGELTITFPNCVTPNTNEEPVLDTSKSITVNGTAVTDVVLTSTGLTASVTFTVPTSIAQGAEVTVVVPAGLLTWANSSPAVSSPTSDVTFTLSTPLMADQSGVYLYSTHAEGFLSRGGEHNTIDSGTSFQSYGKIATTDPYGIPVDITFGDDGLATVKFLDSNLFLYAGGWAWTDGSEANAGKYLVKEVTTEDEETVYQFCYDGGDDSFLYVNDENYEWVANNGNLTGDNNLQGDITRTYWQIFTMAERDEHKATFVESQKAEIAEAVGATDLDTYIASQPETDVTDMVASAALAGSLTGWTETDYYSDNSGTYFATGDWGTEIYQGDARLLQTITGLEQGVYKVTLQGLVRQGFADTIIENELTDYDLSIGFLEANGYQINLQPWASEADLATQSPSNTSVFNDYTYANELYTYVGSDGSLELSINCPDVLYGGWMIFKNLTLTYYGEIEELDYDYDVTWKLANPSFEADKVVANLTVDTTRGNEDGGAWTVESLTGWELAAPTHSTESFKACDIMSAEATATDNNLGAPGKPSDGTYMLYLREAHSGYSGAGTSASVKQSVTLPAGDYMVTVDSKCVASASYDGTVTLVADDHSKNIGIGLTSIPEDWTTTSLAFSLDAETEVTLGVEIAYSGDAGLSVLLDNFTLLSAEEIEESITWEMTSAGWGTMILPFAASIPEGLTLYDGNALTIDESTITVGTEATAIVANTPYLVSGSANTYEFTGTPTNTADTYTEGVLTGTLVDLAVAKGAAFATDGTQYLLQNQEEVDGVAFYPIIAATEDAENSANATLNAYHCYLTIESEDGEVSPTKLSIVLPGAGEETGIVAVESDVIANDAIYDLSGRRVAKAVKGVYIQNGKKVLVK